MLPAWRHQVDCSGYIAGLLFFQGYKQAGNNENSGHQQDIQHALAIDAGKDHGTHSERKIDDGNDAGINQVHA